MGARCLLGAFLASGVLGHPLQIRQLQLAALVQRAARADQKEQARQQFPAEHVRLLCVNCMEAVGHGSDLRKVEGAHHVNVNPNFS